MARIRTIKPEAFISESLAAVSVHAERTFFGLLTQADDHGRFRDQAAVIAGALWSLRPEHGPLEVEDDLTQLDGAGLVCRYEGDDGKRYLHIVTWARHQKINRPSGSRCPACPRHQGSRSTEPASPVHGVLREQDASPHRGGPEGSGECSEPSVNREVAGQGIFSEPSPQRREMAVRNQGPDLGPRILDLGSPPVGSASAPAPPAISGAISARDLVGEYVASCEHRPPSDVLGRLGKVAGKLLGEGISAEHIRAGMSRMRAKGLSANLLPSLVNEAMNAPQAAAAPHRAWTNPASSDVEAAYGGQL
ncbi:hypothetical protein ACIGJO_25510 [Streptomyces sp. NPDC079020]|uniref:hypothetical protein n=1 Tax=unclassified Streptomyces TaxID=2593676 RepID=UPI0011C8E4E7|nr:MULTISPECIES: hypothetical protein [unclassified Streptomyces]TXS17253.1 hypothetical protein EAO68_05355 [Streptomyces sp. wa22]WSQ79022.1 hypothetical protein OG725_18795 [Streptomyces sp. NBC_01213]WSQ86391.1 hypothetical protein OG722_19405 [Streptomyces sp. NBC_01212]